MKYSFSLISKLYSISLIWFGLVILSLVYVVLNLIFPNTDFMIKRSKSIWGSENIFKNGYNIPASITIQLPPDTVIRYTKGNTKGEINLFKENRFRSKIADSILKDTSIKKDFHFYKWVASPSVYAKDTSISWSGDSEIELFNNEVKYYSSILNVTPNSSYNFITEVSVKTNNFYKNLLLLISSLAPLIFSLIVSFQFMKITKQLYNKISFMKNIYRRLNIAGLAIIGYQIFQFIIGFIYQYWYGSVGLRKYPHNTYGNINEFNVQFNPSMNTSSVMVLLGLSLIALSYIFKYGKKLEEENALTV